MVVQNSMKVLIVSDSHGNIPVLKKILEKELPCDFIIHCGDGVEDLQHFDTGDAERLMITGNMDLSNAKGYARSIITSIGGCKVFIAHGDIQRAHQDYVELYSEGQSNRCDAVIFGHTHRPYIGRGTPVLFNPGPALNGLYGIAIIDKGIEFIHRNINEE